MALTVASWPGYGLTQNGFLRIFLDGLADADCDIVSLSSLDEMATLDGVDVVVLHWVQRVFWEATTRAGAVSNIARLGRLLRGRPPGTRVVWLAHDLKPHDAEGLQRLLWTPLMSMVLREVDGFATLSERTVASVLDEYPQLRALPSIALRHPRYPGQRASIDETRSARAAAGFSATDRVIGYCGQLRHNKGMGALAAAFRGVADSNARLHIAGAELRSAASVVAELREHARADRRIHLSIGDLDDAAFTAGLLCCDVIAAPFGDYLHSGSLIHALSVDRPVLTPSTPFADGLVDDLGDRWVTTYDGPLTAADLAAALGREQPRGSALGDAYEPNVIGQTFATWLSELSA